MVLQAQQQQQQGQGSPGGQQGQQQPGEAQRRGGWLSRVFGCACVKGGEPGDELDLV
jgi:hypothetical protein